MDKIINKRILQKSTFNINSFDNCWVIAEIEEIILLFQMIYSHDTCISAILSNFLRLHKSPDLQHPQRSWDNVVDWIALYENKRFSKMLEYNYSTLKSGASLQ